MNEQRSAIEPGRWSSRGRTRPHAWLSRARTFYGSSKVFWGLAAVILAGIILSPTDADGANIFLSAANLTDVLREVAITGVVAVGMTVVILTGGIDLSVGSVMGLGATVSAMLLTQRGWHNGALIAVPASAFVCGSLVLLVVKLLVRGSKYRWPLALIAGFIAGGLVWSRMVPLLATGFGTISVVIAALCVGLLIGVINGLIIAWGRLQPFIATLAMMVTALGIARLMAGEDQSVYAIYAGTNSDAGFSHVRDVFLDVPIPGLIFLCIAIMIGVLLGRFRFGREVYAVGGNEKASYLAGINVSRVKILAYALSGALATLAGVLYAAQYRQGKADAGAGLELDAIAAVVIGGTSLMGGRGGIVGTLVGVLIFGALTNIFQLASIDSDTQLVLKGIIIIAAVLLQEGRGLNLSWLRSKR